MLEDSTHRRKRSTRNLLGVTILMVTLYLCASMGRPDGGPFDETPPCFIGSAPAAGAANNKKSKIAFDLDEFTKLGKANEKVAVLPPQLQQLEIKPGGKRIAVDPLDSLKPNTTYTIDLSDAIIDNNGGNPLDNSAFTFPMGTSIDMMEVLDTLLEASDLEPIKGMLVGPYSNLNDLAFTKSPFDHVIRTDSHGHFMTRGVTPGKYRTFSLMGVDQNLLHNQKVEAVALNDSLIIPRFEERVRQDITWVDSLTTDTIVEQKYIYYLPGNIVPRSFRTPSVSQYLVKNERFTPQKFSPYFSAPAGSLPVLKGLNFDERDAFIVGKTLRNDTIHHWIRDSLLYKQDTLTLSLNYLYTGTLNQSVPRTDTLRLATKKVKKEEPKKKKKKDDEPESTKLLSVNTHAPPSMDVFDHTTLTFEEPVVRFDSAAIHLRQKVDTIWTDVSFEFEHDLLDVRRYNLCYDWESGGEYELAIGPIAFHGIYGLFTNKIKQAFRVRQIEEYGNVFLNITGADSVTFVELLDDQDKVFRRCLVVGGRAEFYYLNPGKYGARLINDTNSNGVWDPGDYEKGIQPETVYYYSHIIEFKANWDTAQDWNVTAVSLDKQKPGEPKKQRLDEDKKKKTRDSQNVNRNRRNN